jgi:hypothetical protein
MKRIGTLLMRAIVAALLLLSLGASLASANAGAAAPYSGGVSGPTALPEDPGLE